jgi:GNAT superfamily N-acetyltransferase
VGVRDGETRVLGYYAISSHHVSFQSLPHHEARHLPEIDMPVVLLGRLAVDESAQGHGLGQLLLLDALRRAQHLATEVGICAVEVDAIDQDARRFYLRFGFTPLTDDPKHLFLPMLVIRKLNLPPLHRP